jgi:hypothetical protein
MTRTASTEPPADHREADFCSLSLMELLIAQCADLEALLALARRETDAAERGDFDELMRVVEARATLGERLEVYHRQIAELRQRLGAAGEAALRSAAAAQATTLATEILALDARTRPLLLSTRNQLSEECLRLDQTRRGANAYLREGHRPPIAYDQRA